MFDVDETIAYARVRESRSMRNVKCVLAALRAEPSAVCWKAKRARTAWARFVDMNTVNIWSAESTGRGNYSLQKGACLPAPDTQNPRSITSYTASVCLYSNLNFFHLDAARPDTQRSSSTRGQEMWIVQGNKGIDVNSFSIEDGDSICIVSSDSAVKSDIFQIEDGKFGPCSASSDIALWCRVRFKRTSSGGDGHVEILLRFARSSVEHLEVRPEGKRLASLYFALCNERKQQPNLNVPPGTIGHPKRRNKIKNVDIKYVSIDMLNFERVILEASTQILLRFGRGWEGQINWFKHRGIC
jgi:hypothetical protein